ncbi:MAG: tol-pal system-associated acyl-CoA thioesterase [Candidatus Protistobacter heckmanni]|nr:tol-pal system-associated acyl-CoA thioesterase [Candidatus Protistobacter heckmanni]
MNQFEWTVRVYWEDTDGGGGVFYANYLKFFERARTEWLRSLGVGQQDLAERTGAMFIVSRTAVDYHFPARLDDALVVRSRIERLGRASVEFDQQAWLGDKLLAGGRIRVGCVDRGSFKPRALPADVRAALEASAGVKAGRPNTDVSETLT